MSVVEEESVVRAAVLERSLACVELVRSDVSGEWEGAEEVLVESCRELRVWRASAFWRMEGVREIRRLFGAGPCCFGVQPRGSMTNAGGES